MASLLEKMELWKLRIKVRTLRHDLDTLTARFNALNARIANIEDADEAQMAEIGRLGDEVEYLGSFHPPRPQG